MKLSDVTSNKTAVIRVLELMNSLPDDEVLTTSELEQQLSISVQSGSIKRNWQKLKDHVELVTVDGLRTRVWGNKKAIATLRSQLNEENK